MNSMGFACKRHPECNGVVSVSEAWNGQAVWRKLWGLIGHCPAEPRHRFVASYLRL